MIKRAFVMPDDGWIWIFENHIASDTNDGREVVAQILEEMQKADWPEHDVFGVHLAIEEALVNAIKHGNRKDPTKMVEVVCRMSHERVQIRISDEGEGFDPEAVPDPTDEENLEIPSGRGLMLMRCYMTSVEFNKRGNAVSMEKVRTHGDPAENGDGDEE
ncbi:MAG: ATP-binding protein [Pirellulaceae bacterium]